MKTVFLFIFISSSVFTQSVYGQNWTTNQISDVGAKPAISISDNDEIYIAYLFEDFVGFVRLYNHSKNETTELSEGYYYGPLDIAAKGSGEVYVALHDHDVEDQIVIDVKGENIDILQTVDSGHDGWDNSIVVSQNGNIHTSTVDPNVGIEYGFYDGAWQVERVIDAEIDYAFATSIALDRDGIPHISFYNEEIQKLQLARKEGRSWSIETVDDNIGTGQFSSIAIDENNQIFISYYQDGGIIKLASFDGGKWNIEMIDRLNNLELSFTGARNVTNLDLFEDKIGVSYGDKDVVKMAIKTGDSWIIETVYERIDLPLGQMTSLAFDSQGVPNITFSDVESTSRLTGNIYHAVRDFSSPVENVVENIFSIIPNPATANSYLDLTGDLDSFETYKIISIGGKVIRHQSLRSKLLSTHGLESGMYMFQIHDTKNQKISVQKLIIE